MAISVHNLLMKDGNFVHRMELKNVRNYGTDEKESMLSSTKIKLSALKLDNDSYLEYIRRSNQERGTVGSMLHAIRLLTDEHLLDREIRIKHDLDLSIEMWYEEDECCEYLLAIFEHSDKPLAIELKQRLKNAGIHYHDFCRNLAAVFSILYNYSHFFWPEYKIEAADVIHITKLLNFNNTHTNF